MLQIDWATHVSAHTGIRLLSRLEALECLDSQKLTVRDPANGALHHFERVDGRLFQRDLPDGAPSHLSLPPQGRDIRMNIGTLYRDGSNYKTYRVHELQGPLDEDGLDLILTVLFMDDEEGIIPHQIGLQDHQGSEGWELDFDTLDHPWHEVTEVELQDADKAPANPEVLSMASFLDAVRERADKGWDTIAAMTVLTQK